MKCRFLLTVGVILWSTWSGFAIEKTTVNLDNLVKTFEQNPANPQTTMQLLKELSKQGKSGQDILNRYFKTQSEADYFKDYNWMIVRDYVNDINAPQLKYVFENQDKFIQHFSKDDVFQKLDNVLVNHLEQLYLQNKADYENQMKRIKETGYEHYDVVLDYFNIKELRLSGTAGALEIMNDVSRLKVIQLWAGKTVESKSDFDAIYNYVKISQKCGFNDIAKKYANIANNLANQSQNQLMKQQASELIRMLN